MTKNSSSRKLSTEMRDQLIESATERARQGEDIRAGTRAFWDLFSDHMTIFSEVLDEVFLEVQEEKDASNGEVRFCPCGQQIFKKHKRGRWPTYCDGCR